MSDLPAEVEKLIDQVQYEEAGEFPVERGYIYTSCSSVENGNPLFWDDDAARGDHRWSDRAPDDDLGVVPPAPVVAGPDRARGAVAGRTST